MVSSYHSDPVVVFDGALPLITNDAFALSANEAVFAKLEDREDSANVAYDADATDPDCATVTSNCVPSPFVKVIVVLVTLAVTMLLVANEDVTAYEEDTEFVAQLDVPTNVPINDPLNDPVLIWVDEDTNPDGRIVGAYEADVAKLALAGIKVILVAALDVVANEAVSGTNVILVAADAVIANELVVELFAQLDVPVRTPTNEPVNDPVFICAELDTVPLGNIVGAYEAEVANELDTVFCAQLLVPKNSPMNDPLNDPVFICVELDTTPGGNVVGA